jgi:hypothetical protein
MGEKQNKAKSGNRPRAGYATGLGIERKQAHVM